MNKRVVITCDYLPITTALQATEALSVDTPTFYTGIKIAGSNVVSEQLHLKTTNNTIDKLIIYNTIGQKLETVKTKNVTNLAIDVSELASGIYYISSSNKFIKPLKFVIQ